MTIHLDFRRLARRAGMCLIAVLVFGVAYLGTLQLTGNFNTVVEGELYRSGQLSPAQIEKYTKRFGIKTIINLRGDNTGSAWYDGEVTASNRLNVTHVDFGISARRELTAVQGAALINLMKTAQKPILVHCQAGADRSGLASALYMGAIKESDDARVGGQLTIRYGHFSLPFIPEYAMDRSLRALEPLLRLRSRNALAVQHDEMSALKGDPIKDRAQ